MGGGAGRDGVMPAMEVADEAHDLVLAGMARARRIAMCEASVPDAVKRTFSADGISSQTSSAQRTSSSWLDP